MVEKVIILLHPCGVMTQKAKKKKKKKRKLKGSIGDDGFKRIEGWFKTIRSWDGYLHLGFGTVRFCPVEGGGGGLAVLPTTTSAHL